MAADLHENGNLNLTTDISDVRLRSTTASYDDHKVIILETNKHRLINTNINTQKNK